MRTTPIARCSRLDAETFTRAFSGRAPVVVCGAMDDWRARRTWSHEWFAEHHGGLDVEVQTWTDGRMGGLQMTLAELVRVARGDGDGIQHCVARSPVFDAAPELRVDFAPPPFLGARRLRSSLFLGSAGLVTPVHFELSDGLLCQVVGRKRVLLFAPELRSRLGYPPLYKKPFFFGSVDPEGARANGDGRLCAFTAELNPGEMLYVPSRWHHHIRSLDRTISVNFLWMRPAARVLAAVLSRLGRAYD